MKKGITVYTKYDRCGRWTLIVEKEKGKLTLDDIRQAATEWGEDHYLLHLNCMSFEEDELDEPAGDQAVLYAAEALK